jgi:hypothetical protein
MFIVFPHTKFSIPFSIGPVVMTVKLKSKLKMSHIPHFIGFDSAQRNIFKFA